MFRFRGVAKIIWSPRYVTCVLIQAKGELRAAQVEIDGLKQDKAILGKTLDIKAKEIRMQLLQVFAVTGNMAFRRYHK